MVITAKSTIRPNILIFDSGIGGITVYNEIQQKIPQANFAYLFDNQGFPYGDKSSDYLVKRVKDVMTTFVDQNPVDMAVIACNTVSTICLPVLRDSFNFPIVGVVPAIKPATKITRNRCIGLLATKATISRQYTHNLIQEFATGFQIELLGLSELAIIAEKKLQGESVDLDQLANLLCVWQKLPVIPDTIVLGCTHYPFIQPELQNIFPNATFIDSGCAVATRVHSLLKENFDLKIPQESPLNRNVIFSTLYSSQVEAVLKNLKNYNLNKYQLIKILSD